jgi:iron complex transport system ATP-binding protein
MLTIAGASFHYRGRDPVFSHLDLTLGRGQVLSVLGPNGVGKSTLLRCLAGLETLSAGSVQIDGARPSPGRSTGFVPQSDQPVFAFDVRTVVEMGRAPHLSWTATPGPADRAIVDGVMARLGISTLAHRLYPELSGGERQLVMIARALAQQPALLILDEPTSHLDFANQAGVLDLVHSLAREGLAVVMTTHNPDHAFLCADQVLMLSRGGAHSIGPVAEVVTEQRLSATYGRPIRILRAEGRVFCFAESAPGL